MANQIISNMKLDEENRILVLVNSEYQSYLANEKIRQMIKQSAIEALGDNFIKLEVAKTACRITVKEGTENNSLEIIRKELFRKLEMAVNFLKFKKKGEYL